MNNGDVGRVHGVAWWSFVELGGDIGQYGDKDKGYNDGYIVTGRLPLGTAALDENP